MKQKLRHRRAAMHRRLPRCVISRHNGPFASVFTGDKRTCVSASLRCPLGAISRHWSAELTDLHRLDVDSYRTSYLKRDHVTDINLIEPLNGETDFNSPGLAAGAGEGDSPLEAINRSDGIGDFYGREIGCALRGCFDRVFSLVLSWGIE